MSRRPSSLPHPPPAAIDPDPDLDADTARLDGAAQALLDAALAEPGPPELVGLVDAASQGVAALGGRPDLLVLSTLDGHDPVTGLLGVTAPPEWWAAGVVTGARARTLDAPVGVARGGTFVHLVARSGVSVSLLAGDDGTVTVDRSVGRPPEEAPVGRLADACRRVLGLPTAPPPGDMTAYVVDTWLSLVARQALDDPGLAWPDVVALHPGVRLTTSPPDEAAPPACTPAEMAQHTRALGAVLDWDRYRVSCVAEGGSPFGELDADAADWMDAGMFARWVLGEMPPWPSVMELLDGLLTAGAADRLWATLALCPPAPWPPGRTVP